ncbi:MAG TPA: glycosyltransferase family A protein, partial [Chitinophagaceae bacterium]|nr:glycosyltransferase family A protein [Chitinophagaceae bacterium]
MQVSVVVPTYNRRQRLLLLLGNLNDSVHPVEEVIIVDAGNDMLLPADLSAFPNLAIVYLLSRPSVCVQRNTGIKAARYPWIFICDDDIEVPADYLAKLSAHIEKYPRAGAVTGMILQQANGKWLDRYNIVSVKQLFARYIFGLGIWGNITCNSNNYFVRKIK